MQGESKRDIKKRKASFAAKADYAINFAESNVYFLFLQMVSPNDKA